MSLLVWLSKVTVCPAIPFSIHLHYSPYMYAFVLWCLSAFPLFTSCLFIRYRCKGEADSQCHPVAECCMCYHTSHRDGNSYTVRWGKGTTGSTQVGQTSNTISGTARSSQFRLVSLTHGQDRSRIAISCSYYLLIVLAIRLLILIVATNLCAVLCILLAMYM